MTLMTWTWVDTWAVKQASDMLDLVLGGGRGQDDYFLQFMGRLLS